jgi:hypothetical protein
MQACNLKKFNLHCGQASIGGVAMLKAAIEKLGGYTQFARRYALNENTVASWIHRGAVPASVILGNPVVARALRRAGYRHEARNAKA